MPDPFQPETLAAIAFIGMVAGTLGGMLGVGGSVVIIPALAILFGTGKNQHLYQAAAMTANLAVALPAARRHHKAGALKPEVLKWMLPATIICIVLGVFASNLPIFSVKDGGEGGLWLGRILSVFLIYVIYVNIRKLLRTAAQKQADWEREHLTTPARCGTVGSIMGFAAGLMGIGGGGLAVPLQQTLCKLPLRNAIANSSFVMVFSAGIGAVLKLSTLDQHYATTSDQWPAWQVALVLALILAPTAIIGSIIGAKLTHTLRIRYVRIAFVCMMIAAAYKMAAIPL